MVPFGLPRRVERRDSARVPGEHTQAWIDEDGQAS